MDRRDALKALGSMAAASGMTITPITEKQAERAALLILRTEERLTDATAQSLKHCLQVAIHGTPLEGTRVVVLSHGMTLELVTK